jgi:hypothetical protein
MGASGTSREVLILSIFRVGFFICVSPDFVRDQQGHNQVNIFYQVYPHPISDPVTEQFSGQESRHRTGISKSAMLLRVMQKISRGKGIRTG